MLAPLLGIIQECWSNRLRLWRLASYDLKVRNSGTVLGFLWNFLNPALQIFVYWFVFAIGLKSSAPQGEYSYLIWMIVGIMPWFFISSAMMTSLTSIVSFRGVLKRMKFPVSLVPIKSVLSFFIEHLWAMLVVLVLFLAGGHHLGINSLGIVYYMLCAIVFLVAYGLLTSAINVVFRDFQKFMSAVLRLLFYVSPVVWSPANLSVRLQDVLRLNPIAYLIDGYRNSILYNTSLLENWQHGLYFWGVTVIMLLLGAFVHNRLRKQFMDMV